MLTAEIWVLVSFILFLALVVYFGAPRMVTKALDDRAEAIRKELDEARRLREEAQGVLAEYQRKREGAGQEAEDIIAQATEEARLMREEAKKNLAAMVERRTRQAEDKIAQAETDATREVRERAASLAAAAARDVVAGEVDAARDADLIAQAIKGVGDRLH